MSDETEKDRKAIEQLEAIIKATLIKQDVESLNEIVPYVLHIIRTANVATRGDLPLALAVLTMAVGYAYRVFIEETSAIPGKRNYTDEEIRQFALGMSTEDLQAFFSGHGLSMWQTFWRPRQ